MDERDKLIRKLIEEKGGSREDYLNLLNSIAYHESAHTMDPSIKQYGGGPGRGKYQFEEGDNSGGITAARRTKQYYESINKLVPEWLKKAADNKSLDASTLSSSQQDILFLGNMRMHPKANFKNVWDGKESISDFWANYHWAGANKDRKTRLKSFNNSLEKYNQSKPTKPIKLTKPNINLNIKPEQPRVFEQDKTDVDTETYKPNVNYNFSNFKDFDSLVDYIRNTFKSGGLIGNINNNDKKINSFNTGGLHDQNPLGGIPLGIGGNGKMNTVEEGETSFELKRGKFVFSNRIKI